MQYLGIMALIIAQFIFCLLGMIIFKHRKNSIFYLVVVLINILITIDLGNNYTIALSGYSDGIAIYGIFSQIIIYEEIWSIQLFENYYHFFVIYTVITILVYFITNIKNLNSTKSYSTAQW